MACRARPCPDGLVPFSKFVFADQHLNYNTRPMPGLFAGPIPELSAAFYEFISVNQRSDYVRDPCLNDYVVVL